MPFFIKLGNFTVSDSVSQELVIIPFNNNYIATYGYIWPIMVVIVTQFFSK